MRPDYPMYFDRQGNPIDDPLEWAELNTPEYKRVAATTIGDVHVSTVWIGIDMGLGWMPDHGDLPVIFETMVFVNPKPDQPLHPEMDALDQACWRYPTEAEAVAGHDKVCVEIRVLLGQIRMADEVLAEAIEKNEGN